MLDNKINNILENLDADLTTLRLKCKSFEKPYDYNSIEKEKDGDGKALASCLYPVNYLNESLLYDFLYDNAILLIFTSLILTGFLFL